MIKTKINFAGINQEVNNQLLHALEVNQNLVNTSGITAGNNFAEIASRAYIDVASGKKSSDSAVRAAVNELLDGGVLKVTYPSGRKVNIASAVATNVRTTLKHATMDVSLDVCDQLGATHVEVSWHGDCAPDHQWMQGNVYKIGSPEYHRVLEALNRPNCRHSISPFLKGFSTKTKHPNTSKSKMTKVYEREQYETAIANRRRKARLEASLLGKTIKEQTPIAKFNVVGLNKKLVNNTIDSIKKVSSDYDLPSGYVSVIKQSTRKNMFAGASQSDHSLTLNPDYFKSESALDKAYKKSVASGFHPKGTNYKSIVVHEMGHFLNYRLSELRGVAKEQAATAVVHEAWNNIKDTTTMAYLSEAKADISQYALKNDKETIAEAFADFQANGRHAKMLSIAIVKVLKQKLKI